MAVSSYNKAKVLFEQYSIPEAQIFIDVSLIDTPKKPSVLLLASKIYSEQDEAEASLNYAKRALKHSYSSIKTQVLKNLAEAYYYAGFSLEKRSCLKKSYLIWRKLVHNNKTLDNYAGLLEVSVDLQRCDDIISAMNNALKIDRAGRFSRALYSEGCFDLSIKYIKKIIKRNKDNFQAYVTLSDILYDYSKLTTKIKSIPELNDPLKYAYIYAKKALDIKKNSKTISEMIIILNKMIQRDSIPEFEDIQRYYDELKKLPDHKKALSLVEKRLSSRF
ncbi:Uncharacterised protein [Candidatus Tiddalikarchaeum anstoanum]|nr:Uncharacterised protein [Candidatus Tiddalikarchaeum anstoanum]